MPREKLNLKHGDDGLVAENEASETEMMMMMMKTMMIMSREKGLC